MSKIKKGTVKTIVIAGVAVLVVLAVFITNLFIPVRYLSAYVIFIHDRNSERTLRVTFLDVGYSDCTLIEFPDGGSALIDCGSGTYSDTLEILRLLNKRGIDNIDYLILSSTDCGGAEEILTYKTVTSIYAPFALEGVEDESYQSFLSAANGSGANLTTLEYGVGQSFYTGCFFTVLSPSVHTLSDEEYVAANADLSDENLANSSAVIWLQYSGVSFLLLGNSYTATAQKLYDNYVLDENYYSYAGKKVKFESCTIVKAAAHGSVNAAYAPLYSLLEPEAAIISVGSNSDDCPSAEVISDIYPYAGRNIYRTDEDGTITVTVSGGEYVIDKEK